MRDQQDAGRPECRDLSEQLARIEQIGELGKQLERDYPEIARLSAEVFELQKRYDELRRRDG